MEYHLNKKEIKELKEIDAAWGLAAGRGSINTSMQNKNAEFNFRNHSSSWY